MTMNGIFDGLRVLDFTQVLAGPTATRLMVEMGAEVIKVEMQPAGDVSRALPRIRDGRSGYHVQQNRGKKSLFIDLKDPRGRELVLDLIPEIDVLVQNFAAGVIERLGFGWADVSPLNPSLVMASLSAFGRTGPLADQPGYDPVAQAYGGVLHMLGYEDRPPVQNGTSPGDVLTGVHGLAGISAALFHRERTGEGQEISVSLLDAYVTTHEVNWQDWSVANGEIDPIRKGSQHPVVGACGVFPVGSDGGNIVIAAVNDRQWAALCRVMGGPELADDPAFDSNGRIENRDATNRAILDWLATETDRDDVMARLQAARVPAAPVLTIAEAANHPHLLENRTLRWVPDDVLGEVLVPGMPIKFSAFPDELPLMTRQLGADNEYVARELARRSEADYDALVGAGVLKHVERS